MSQIDEQKAADQRALAMWNAIMEQAKHRQAEELARIEWERS